MIEDFINSDKALISARDQRKTVFSNLLIDANIRFGDILIFREDIENAITSY